MFLSVWWEISVPSNQNLLRATPWPVSIAGLTTSLNRNPRCSHYNQAQQPCKFTSMTLMSSPWDKTLHAASWLAGKEEEGPRGERKDKQTRRVWQLGLLGAALRLDGARITQLPMSPSHQRASGRALRAPEAGGPALPYQCPKSYFYLPPHRNWC